MLATRLLLFSCAVIGGWTFVATKILLAHVDPLQLVGLRFAIGLPLLYAVVRKERIPLAFERRDAGPLALGAAIVMTHFIVQSCALRYTTATNTGWIIAVSPLAMAVLAFAVLKEHVGARQVAGIVLATLGILLLKSQGEYERLEWLENVGDWMVLGTALTWALYTIVTRDVARRRPALAVTLVVFAPLTLACLAYTVATLAPQEALAWPRDAWIALLFLGTLGTLAQWFWQIGVARLGAARAGLFLYLEPIATTALAVPLLGEPFGIAGGLGGALVLAGVYWAQRKE
jgi:drug/metabolite transporter (DMT)-like permease